MTSSAAGTSRDRWVNRNLNRNDVTEIIPFNEFGILDDLDFSDNWAFDTEARVLLAPELDDLLDDLTPLRLAAPRAGSSSTHGTGPMAELPRRGGQHRKQATGVAKGRLLIGAMAAGAVAAATHSATHHSDTATTAAVLAANASTLNGGAAAAAPRGVQVIAVRPAANVAAMHNEELAKGVAFAQERAQREARLRQPLFVMPTRGMFTSNFGYRWGVLHAGIDIANAVGTPIVAVSDGVVVDAGPTAGYGMWVKLRHADGTVTLYGHVNTTTVRIGERVLAGDQIATIGARGNSTGPHLHFEVLAGGTDRIDPVPWLATRGLSVGAR